MVVLFLQNSKVKIMITGKPAYIERIFSTSTSAFAVCAMEYLGLA